MAYDTWDWDKNSGSGPPSRFSPDRVDPLLVQDIESGVFSSEPLFTCGHWLLTVNISVALPQNYIWLVNWRDTHRGIPFYISWPYEMAGAPDEIEFADPGGLSPWSSEAEVLAGMGPTFLVVWINDNLPADRRMMTENCWSVSSIQLRQV